MAEDYPHALDVEIWDGAGRKIGLYHVRGMNAAEFIAELREVDDQYAAAVTDAVTAVRSHFLLRTELGAKPVASPPARPARQAAPPRQPAPSYEGQDVPFPDDFPPGDEQGPPTCAHGPMRYVKAGTSNATGKPYNAFYGCQADRNDPNRCKSVSA
jgi:hypothetical protein